MAQDDIPMICIPHVHVLLSWNRLSSSLHDAAKLLCRSWLSTTKEEHRKGPPLTCLLCKGVLILNAEGLQSHIGSKRHQKLTKKLEDPAQDTIVYAQDLQEDSSGMRHQPSQ